MRVEGIRNRTISSAAVQKLIQGLRSENFFQWEEKEEFCVDYPEVQITATLKGQHKHVLEG